jgi:hypothetical protein
MIAFKALLMQFFWFYRIDFPMELFPKDLTYTRFKQGTVIGKRHLDPHEYERIKGLFSKNKNGWRYDMVSYAPDHLYTSPEMNINCGGTRLVVNYPQADKRWIQVSKEIAAGSCPTFELVEDNKNG